MADIVMCQGLPDNPMCGACHRRMDNPGYFRQSYFTDPPMDDDGSCEFYYPTLLKTPEGAR